MTNIYNLTPHAINVHTAAFAEPLVFPSLGQARLVEETHDGGESIYLDPYGDGGMTIHVPVVGIKFGRVDGLPEPVPGTVYVVSRMIVDALPARSDLVAPHDVVRDGAGRIIGCRGFSR